MSCGVGGRLSWDLALLWLWCRRVATAPICPLAWEPPYAAGAALKKKKKKKKKLQEVSHAKMHGPNKARKLSAMFLSLPQRLLRG